VNYPEAQYPGRLLKAESSQIEKGKGALGGIGAEIMVPRLKDIVALLEDLAPAELAESWDNPGLQVGFLDHRIEKMVLSLDPTLQAVSYAWDHRAQLLLTHHPLIFRPMSSVKGGDYPGGVVYEAIRCGVSIVAVHTNLDAAHEGINAILGDLLGLERIDVLNNRDQSGPYRSKARIEPRRARTVQRTDLSKGNRTGIGRIGDLRAEKTLYELVTMVKGLLRVSSVRVVGKKDMKIRRVAVVGGSGGSLIREAYAKGADLLITGDVSYHQAREAEFFGLAVIDGGHFATEKVAFAAFGKQLAKEMEQRNWKVEILHNDKENDPIRAM